MKAFPLKNPHLFDDQEGMDLRDYFAAKALQGILFDGLDPNDTAKFAYEYADAMMKAREQ